MRTKSSSFGDLVVVSRYFGKVIEREGYDYAPSVHREYNGFQRMWWTGGSLSSGIIDDFFYAESSDGENWTEPLDVMESEPLALAADPSVVQVSGIYYMYMTGTWNPASPGEIYLATSTDGIHWTRYPDNENPEPVIERQSPTIGAYGAGQPSALYLDGKFVVYFLDQTEPEGLYRAESTDGIQFGQRTFILGVNDVDVKYCPALGLYLMIRHGQFADEFSRACLHISYDGVNFTPIDNNKFVIGPPDLGGGFQLASGIVGNAFGIIGEEPRVIYAAGEPGNSNADTWDLHQSELYFLTRRPAHVYRFSHQNPTQTDHSFSLTVDSPPEYNYDGEAWRTLQASELGATPLYALYHPLWVDHFYTADLGERFRAAISGYHVQGEEGYVSLAAQPGLVPLYRLYNATSGDHFYTIDWLERDLFIQQYGYQSEGLAGYVHWPAGVMGDLDASGVLDAADFELLKRSLTGDRAMPAPAAGDLTRDRKVTVADLLKLSLLLENR